MKTITFNYQKKDGSKSERTLITMVEPGNKYAGIDISELDPIDAAKFAKELSYLYKEHLFNVRELQDEFDLKFAYKNFLSDGMSEITVI
jgi:hypothetical protein